jgi:hypothetical protein
MTGRVETLYVCQFALLVDVDEDFVLGRTPQAGALDLSRLEYRVSIRQDDSRPPLLDVLECLKSAGVVLFGKRIVDQPARHAQDFRAMHRFNTVAFQRAEIVGVAKLVDQLF